MRRNIINKPKNIAGPHLTRFNPLRFIGNQQETLEWHRIAKQLSSNILYRLVVTWTSFFKMIPRFYILSSYYTCTEESNVTTAQCWREKFLQQRNAKKPLNNYGQQLLSRGVAATTIVPRGCSLVTVARSWRGRKRSRRCASSEWPPRGCWKCRSAGSWMFRPCACPGTKREEYWEYNQNNFKTLNKKIK